MTHYLWLLSYCGCAFLVLLAFGLLKAAGDGQPWDVAQADDPESIWYEPAADDAPRKSA